MLSSDRVACIFNWFKKQHSQRQCTWDNVCAIVPGGSTAAVFSCTSAAPASEETSSSAAADAVLDPTPSSSSSEVGSLSDGGLLMPGGPLPCASSSSAAPASPVHAGIPFGHHQAWAAIQHLIAGEVSLCHNCWPHNIHPFESSPTFDYQSLSGCKKATSDTSTDQAA